jgi:hypothetical protein
MLCVVAKMLVTTCINKGWVEIDGNLKCEGYNVWSLIVEDSTLLMLRVAYKIVFGDSSSHIEEYRCPMNLDFLANFVFCDKMWSKQNTRKTKCSSHIQKKTLEMPLQNQVAP